MTDKLADALKKAHERIKYLGVVAGERHAKSNDADFLPVIEQALTEHEATKAATPDDVREAVGYCERHKTDQLCDCKMPPDDVQMAIKHFKKRGYFCMSPDNHPDDDKHVRALINAALRNTQGVPREVVDALDYYAKDAMRKSKCHVTEEVMTRFEYEDAGRRARNALAILDQHARGG